MGEVIENKTKICSKCKIEKDLKEFYFRKKEGVYISFCKECISKSRKDFYYENKERLNKAHREYGKEYYYKNKKEILDCHREYKKQRKKIDIEFKLAINLRKRLGSALKRNQKSGSAVCDLGCSIEFLKQYLESKFHLGMTWENWGHHGWHIDHIVPLSSFDLIDREQFLKACHYTNLQPLWAEENIKKGNKV